jgi:hypothetical protein
VNGTRSSKKFRAGKLQVDLPAQGALAIEHDKSGARCVYRSWTLRKTRAPRWVSAETPLAWSAALEPMPDEPRGPRTFEPAELPHNMLHVTRDESDYGWYRTEIDVPRARKARLRLRVGDRAAVWANGAFQASAPSRLYEWRVGAKRFDAEIDVRLQRGKNVLLVLVSSLGMVKGDWMIGRSQSTEWKGLQGAWLDGKAIRAQWAFSSATRGERAIARQGSSDAFEWQPIQRKTPRLAWYRATFELNDRALADRAPLAFVPGKLKKGMLWLNGHGLGRYWQLPAKHEIVEGDEWLVPYIQFDPPGKPTQSHYHVPREWLARENTLLVFEEEGGSPASSRLIRRP